MKGININKTFFCNNAFAIVSLCIWIVALFLPMFTIESKMIDGTTDITVIPVWYFAFVYSFPFGLPGLLFFLLCGVVKWEFAAALSNIIYIFCICFFMKKRYKWLQFLLIIIALFTAYEFYFYRDSAMWGDTSYNSQTFIEKHSGYYVWFTSYVVLLIGIEKNLFNHRN